MKLFQTKLSDVDNKKEYLVNLALPVTGPLFFNDLVMRLHEDNLHNPMIKNNFFDRHPKLLIAGYAAAQTAVYVTPLASGLYSLIK